MPKYSAVEFENRNNAQRAKRNREHGATLQTGDTIAYTRLFLASIADRSHLSHSRRGAVLGPADMSAESGHTEEPITARTWLIEIRWQDGAVGRINPANVCRVRSVPFIE